MPTENTPVPSKREAAATSPFDGIRKVDPDGTDYWSSRDLADALGYDDYRNFLNVVEKARAACANAGEDPVDHFVVVTEMIETGKTATRPADAVWMSRYGCYMVAMAADGSKVQVALAKTYFAIQTRRQEIEDSRRLQLRAELKKHNNQLASAAKSAGVVEPKDYAIFQNRGYAGLYGGMTAAEIHKHKQLKRSQSILDHMGSTELAANLFRATQTEEKLRREAIQGKEQAGQAHYDVGKKVRATIKEIGGTMPENLPTADSVKKLESEQRKRLDKPDDGPVSLDE